MKEEKRTAKASKRYIEQKAKAMRQVEVQFKKDQKHQAKEESKARKKELRRHISQGKIYYSYQQYEEAIKEFENALAIDPQYRKAIKHIRKCQKRIEKQNRKELQLAREEIQWREEVEAQREQDNRQREQERLEQVKELYEKGKTYFDQGLYTEAISCFEKVIKLGGEAP